ncbi:MAG TPA: hypothetical protein VIN71_10275 [Pseudomonadales bacterium]
MNKTATAASQQPLWPGGLPSASQLQRPPEALQAAFLQLLQQEGLADDGIPVSLLHRLYLPMAAWIADRQRQGPLLLGINGGQGSGKSTLCRILQRLLEQGFGKHVAAISIDDLYLPRAERQQLASRVHPLLATRGVPGTHDVALAIDILSRLKQGSHERLQVPVFDKAMDDRAPAERWQQLQGPLDIILFEGWCVGAWPQRPAHLQQPVNSLEAEEDPDQHWRRYVNQQLAGPYRDLFALIDRLMMLKIPSMEHVFEWRLLQERKLRESLADQPEAARHVMSEQAVRRFIMHYERITRASLEEMPARADVVLELNDQHQVCRVNMNGD